MAEPIIDYHGTEIKVDLIYKSAGPFVYLELHPSSGESEFARLTPRQAADLAQQLIEATEAG